MVRIKISARNKNDILFYANVKKSNNKLWKIDFKKLKANEEKLKSDTCGVGRAPAWWCRHELELTETQLNTISRSIYINIAILATQNE